MMKLFRIFSRSLIVGCALMPLVAMPAEPDDDVAADTTSAAMSTNDTAITAKVKATLIANSIADISVSTEQGVVSLSGIVQNEAVRQHATKLAANIDGVRGVDYSALSIRDKSVD